MVVRLLRVEGDELPLREGEYPLLDVPRRQLVSVTNMKSGEVRVRDPHPRQILPFDRGVRVWVVQDGDQSIGWESEDHRKLTLRNLQEANSYTSR